MDLMPFNCNQTVFQGVQEELVFVICSRLLQHYDIIICDYFPIDCPYPQAQQCTLGRRQGVRMVVSRTEGNVLLRSLFAGGIK